MFGSFFHWKSLLRSSSTWCGWDGGMPFNMRQTIAIWQLNYTSLEKECFFFHKDGGELVVASINDEDFSKSKAVTSNLIWALESFWLNLRIKESLTKEVKDVQQTVPFKVSALLEEFIENFPSKLPVFKQQYWSSTWS